MFKKISAVLISFSILAGMSVTMIAQAEETKESEEQTTGESKTESVVEEKKSDELYDRYINFFSSIGIVFENFGEKTLLTRTDFAKWLYAFIFYVGYVTDCDNRIRYNQVAALQI